MRYNMDSCAWSLHCCRVSQLRSSLMSITLLVRMKSPLTNLTALLCTILSWFLSASMWGAQTVWGIFKSWPTKCLVSCTLCLLEGWSDIVFQEGHNGVCFLRDVSCMFAPRKVTTNGNSKIHVLRISIKYLGVTITTDLRDGIHM